MSAKGSKFLIGLFVVAGVCILAIAIIWVGASRIFMKGALYATYFDESVQGLQIDSAIKYRGVDIGRVQSIRVAPDFSLIEVLMKIDFKGDLKDRTVASLRTAGITGIVFIELDQLKPEDLASTPAISFKTDYTVIPSKRSEISQMLSDATAVMQGIREIDFAGISTQLKTAIGGIETFLRGERLESIIAHLESTAASLDEAMAGIRETVAEGKINRTLDETLATVVEARQLIAQARQEMESLDMAGKARQAGGLLEDIDTKTRSIANDLQDTSENLKTTSSNLQKLSDSLSQNPSGLFFQPPPPPRKGLE